MKLLRFGARGEEKPGIIDAAGHIRDISTYISELNPRSLGNTKLLNQLRTLKLEDLPVVDSTVRIGACLDAPSKILCVGFNSSAHAAEMGGKLLSKHEMLIFIKPNSSLCGPNDPIFYTPYTKKLDWEAELAVVIGKQGKYIPLKAAKDYILGYTCLNDLSERYLQFETEDKQFTKGKGFDNAAPLGPYLVTKDEINDSSQLNIKLWVNGVLRQDYHSRDYINNDEAVISYLSQYFTLYPGDVISLGSGPGSAKTWGEEHFLKPNDKLVLSINGLGEQQQQVISEVCIL